jgi:hypothetical protein
MMRMTDKVSLAASHCSTHILWNSRIGARTLSPAGRRWSRRPLAYPDS